MSRLNRFIPLSLGLALMAGTSAASAATVGYYEMCNGEGAATQATAITNAGHTPVNITVPDAASLAGLDMFFVTNCNNSGAGFSPEYTDNLPAITNAVAAGMTLMVHDRWVTGGASLVPGSAGITFTRSLSSDIDFPAGSPLLSGSGGTLTNTSLDGFSYSNHGFVAAATLPAGGQVLAHRADPAEGVTVAYGYGAGVVVYSTIPLDVFIGSGNFPAYTMNIVSTYAADTFTTCAAEGLTGDPLKLCRLICESNLQAGTLVPLIRLWVIKMRTDPPCAVMGPALR